MDEGSMPTPEEVIKRQERLYEKIDELCKAVSLFVGLCTGSHAVTDSEQWLARGILLDAIKNKSDPSIDLEEAMSLQNAISQMRKFAGEDSTSVQRLPESYISIETRQNAFGDAAAQADGNSEDGCGGEVFGCISRNHAAAGEGEEDRSISAAEDGINALAIFDENSASDGEGGRSPRDIDNAAALAAEEERQRSPKKSFRVAVPELAWEYKPAKASASCLTRSCFPWKNINPILSFAYIVSRCFDLSVPEVLSKANISSGMFRRLSDQTTACNRPGSASDRNAGKEETLANADYIGKAIGIGNVMDGEYVDSMVGISADDELAMKSGQLSVKTISHIRVIGNGCTAIKNCALRIYMENRFNLLEMRKLARANSAKRRKMGSLTPGDIGGAACSRLRKSHARRASSGGDLLLAASDIRGSDAARDIASDGGGASMRPEGDADGTSTSSTSTSCVQDVDVKSSMRTNKTRLRKAMHEISCCALGHLVSLSDVTATIPDSVKNCFMWLDSQRVIRLSYRPHSGNLDAFGSVLASDMMSFRQLGIAVNQMTFRWLQVSRDSGYLKWNLPVHVKLMGKYASGKSVLFVLLAMCSSYRSVIILTGSSNMGIMPTNAPPTKPVGDVMYCFDEMLGLMTDGNSKLNSDERKVAKMLASLMTAGKVEYITTDKIDDKLVQMTKIIDATPVFAGGTNASDESTIVGARMVSMYVRPDVEGPRCSVHLMCDPWWTNGRNRARAEQVAEQYKMHHSLVLSACKAIEAGGLPHPDDTLFLMYLESTVELLKHNFPEVAGHVRMIDIARPMAAILQIETAVGFVFSPAMMGRDVCGGAKFSLAMCRELMPYLRVSESVAMFVIAFIVHSSSDPIGHKVLRWLSEFIGNYPFVSMHKKAMIDIQRIARGDMSTGERVSERRKKTKSTPPEEEEGYGDEAADDEGEEEGSPADSAACESGDDSMINLGPEIDGEDPPQAPSHDEFADAGEMDSRAGGPDADSAEMDAWFAEIKEMLMSMPCPEIGMQLTRRKKSGNARANDSVLKMLKRSEAEKLSKEDIAVLRHSAEMGMTVPYPMKPKEVTRKELDQAARDLLSGEVYIPKYDYKCEVIKNAEDGRARLYVNMNYIKVPGSADSFAETFMFTHRNSKLTVADVKTVLARLAKKQVPAHLINLVPMNNPDILVGVEANRVRLWFTKGCSIEATVPIMLPGPDCWYVLVESLLSSPMHIVTRVLDNLCNEMTVERSIPLPIPDDRFPFILKTYSARPIPGRKLKCANPTHVGKNELETLPEAIEDTLNSVGLGVAPPRIIEWSNSAELRAIKRFFSENGITAKPEEYTEAAMAASFSRTRDDRGKRHPRYPEAYIEEALKLDDSARDIMRKADLKYANAAQRTNQEQVQGHAGIDE
jgi:hypothetical protein